MKKTLHYLVVALVALGAFALTACSGSDETADGGDKLVLSAERNTLLADGADAIDFRVMYGPKDVSRDAAMHLTLNYKDTQSDLQGGSSRFTAARPGFYTVQAVYTADGQTLTSNTLTVAAEGTDSYFHKLMGLQFTSIGCLGCPLLSKVIREIQDEQPGRLVPVSFHVYYVANDPMEIAMGRYYLNAFNKDNALPRFVFNMRLGPVTMNNVKSIILEEMAKEIASYPTSCGVAISTGYDASARKLDITAKITSNTARPYRCLVMLVEDGIEYPQAGSDDDPYIHYNVVRHVFSSNIYGDRLSSGNALEPGTEIATDYSLTLSDGWKADNMRVVVAAMVTPDDGLTYNCDNINQCKLGENVDYERSKN